MKKPLAAPLSILILSCFCITTAFAVDVQRSNWVPYPRVGPTGGTVVSLPVTSTTSSTAPRSVISMRVPASGAARSTWP